MLYLLWGLLNIGLFLFFVLTCFRATRLIRQSFGLFAAIVFALGLLSFTGNRRDDDQLEPGTNQLRRWKFADSAGLRLDDKEHLDLRLEKTLISEYNLSIEYARDTGLQQAFAISGNSHTTGFSLSTRWKPTYIEVNRRAENGKFTYQVEGIVEWKLLGATVFSQSKSYEGIAEVK